LITIKLARLFIPRKSESGGRWGGNKIKGKKRWKRRTMSYITSLFLFLNLNNPEVIKQP
jgi:hypothetical protein